MSQNSVRLIYRIFGRERCKVTAIMPRDERAQPRPAAAVNVRGDYISYMKLEHNATQRHAYQRDLSRLVAAAVVCEVRLMDTPPFGLRGWNS